MNDLNSLVNSLSKTEQLRFIDFQKKKNKRKDDKNLLLFKLLLDNNLKDSKSIIQKLYHNKNSNAAYHTLRNRLQKSLLSFITQDVIIYDNQEDIHLIGKLVAARKLLQNGLYDFGVNILKSIEEIAIQEYNFTILNEIYITKIQHAHNLKTIVLENVIEKYENNKRHCLLEEQLNIVYASVRKKLNDLIYRGEHFIFSEVIENYLETNHIDIKKLNLKSLYQLIKLAESSAETTKNFNQTIPFIENSYKAASQHKLNSKNIHYHIMINYILANCYFRIKQFSTALHYLNTMHEFMLEDHKRYYKQFQLKYFNLKALINCYTQSLNKAIDIANQQLNKKHPITESKLNLHLSLITYLILKEDYREANKTFQKLQHSDNWYLKKTNQEWIIKKNIIELIIQIELNNTDVVDYKLINFKRKYFQYLKTNERSHIILFVNAVQQHYFNNEDTLFINTIAPFFNSQDLTEKDIFIISFYSWLKAKVHKKNTYDTLIKLIQNKHN